jgi:Mg/Co/Ni transporter MgtE
MTHINHKEILNKSNAAKLSDAPVIRFMNHYVISLRDNYTLKSTIDAFRINHISGAPVVDHRNIVIGIISEYDLLIQAASKSLMSPIEFNTNVISVLPETTLKEVLINLYKKKLKWMPVVDKDNYLQGIVARIDVLNFISENSEKPL